MLHFDNFAKSYGSHHVLKIDHLVIEPGCYWIKGINGSGKSTLLKAIAGIIHFEGDLFLNKNISIKRQTVSYRKLVNFAEDEPVFPEYLTGRELIKVFASAKDAPARQEEYFIESMQMNAYIHQPIRSYSSGMLKKLSIILAFMGNPQIILLDEPLITIDAASLKVLYQWIAEESRNGTSFLLSSHQDLEQNTLPGHKVILVESQGLKLLA